MKFGKLEDIEAVDFKLPDDFESNPPLNKVSNKKTKYYIGCTAWTTKEWKGKIYPSKVKSSEYLLEYGKQFNTVELNTTHYRIPNPDTIHKWCDQTPPDFKFCPKVLKYISHANNLGMDTDRIIAFCDAVAHFEDKLGICFMQLPPYYGIDRIDKLEAFFKVFPKEIPLSVELRHPSFFESAENLAKTVTLLEAYNITFLITDVAGRRDVLHMAMSTPATMVRFVGNNLHTSDYARIDDWCKRLGKWTKKSIDELYFFPHEPENINAPELSSYLYDKLKQIDSFTGRGPVLQHSQKTLFD